MNDNQLILIPTISGLFFASLPFAITNRKEVTLANLVKTIALTIGPELIGSLLYLFIVALKMR